MTTEQLILKQEIMPRGNEAPAQKEWKTARDELPRGPTALIVLLMDLLIKIDPR